MTVYTNTIKLYFINSKEQIGTSTVPEDWNNSRTYTFGEWMMENKNGNELLTYYTNNENLKGTYPLEAFLYIIKISIQPSELIQHNFSDERKIALSTPSSLYDLKTTPSQYQVLINSIDKMTELNGSIIEKGMGKNVTVNYRTNELINSKIICISNQPYILPTLNKTIGLYSMLIFIVFIFFVCILSIIRRNLQKPLKSISSGLQAFQSGNYGYKITENKTKEFDYIIKQFHALGHTINNLITNIYEEQNRTKSAKIKQLQLQINPHFLYNSLSFISSAAKLNMNKEVIEMCYSLSDYYRYTLSLNTETNTLNDELQAIQTYLSIFKMRTQRLHYQINVPEDIRTIPFLPLLLQPIVENSIKYGVESSEGDYWIYINGSSDKDFYYLSVTDNGKQLSEIEIAQINQHIHSDKDFEHIGLKNVYKRLFYHYGNQADLVLTNQQPRGMNVTLIIPISEFKSPSQK